MAPFIYIAALRRTGSTVLSESLTSLPDAFIFREPKLGRRMFTVKPTDADLFRQHGIDLVGFSKAHSGTSLIDLIRRRNRLLHAFRRELVPQLHSVVKQVGVKEIQHRGWRFYAEQFPDIRVVLTARDPRDIFVSTFYRVREGKDHFRRGLSAKELARNLNREFRHQIEIQSALPSVKIKYEELCNDSRVLDEVKSFVGSSIEGIGEVGQFNAANPNRVSEASIHDGEITSSRVARWVREPDTEVVREAKKMIDLMPEYCKFWQYEK